MEKITQIDNNMCELILQFDIDDLRELNKQYPDVVEKICSVYSVYISIEYIQPHTDTYGNAGGGYLAGQDGEIHHVYFSIGYPNKNWECSKCTEDNKSRKDLLRITYRIDNKILSKILLKNNIKKISIESKYAWDFNIHDSVILILNSVTVNGIQFKINFDINHLQIDSNDKSKISNYTRCENYRTEYINYITSFSTTSTKYFSIGVHLNDSIKNNKSHVNRYEYTRKDRYLFKSGWVYTN